MENPLSNSPVNLAQPQKKESFIKEIVKFTVIALAIVIPLRVYVAQPFIVSGHSMDTTFADSQYLIIDEISYRFENPQRGEVIVLKYPRDPKTYFIKRIVGLPGETVISEAGYISIVNSTYPESAPLKLSEKYIDPHNWAGDNFKTTLGPTEYFVMGDNRSHSSDSHIWGPLDRKFIVGRPILRLLPVTKLSVFPGRQVE
jgi:signal peptidase I